MEKKVTKRAPASKKAVQPKELKLTSAAAAVATSPVKKSSAAEVKTEKVEALTAKEATKKLGADVTTRIAAETPKVALSPAFKTLAEPVLPQLARENRARLLMQSPTKVYFYWSLRDNPYQLLHRAFGSEIGSYTLAVKFLDLRHGTEEIHPVEAEGNWWFTVEPDGEYKAEIGFYAPNRPYFRIVFSNTITTPRKNPSPRAATNADWNVSSHKFAEVLDVAGFSQDAFDVAIAGDDHAAAESTTHTAFSSFLGEGDYALHGIAAEDIRYALMALASGASLEDLRHRISPALFAILQANAGNLAADRAMSALGEHFDVDEAEYTEEQIGPAVYGASLVHFPRTLKTRTASSNFGPGGHAPSYSPVSSHSLS